MRIVCNAFSAVEYRQAKLIGDIFLKTITLKLLQEYHIIMTFNNFIIPGINAEKIKFIFSHNTAFTFTYFYLVSTLYSNQFILFPLNKWKNF